MEKENKKATNVQGTEEAKKEGGSNASQTIKQFKGAIANMKRLKMITETEEIELKKTFNVVMKRWIGGNLFEE